MTYSTVYIFPQTLPIHLVTEMGQAIQISIHLPSLFIAQNLKRVIPVEFACFVGWLSCSNPNMNWWKPHLKLRGRKSAFGRSSCASAAMLRSSCDRGF